MDSHSVWTAIALVLIVEGLLPFISPRIWRKTFLQLMQLNDGQIRFIGLGCIVFGMLFLECCFWNGCCEPVACCQQQSAYGCHRPVESLF